MMRITSSGGTSRELIGIRGMAVVLALVVEEVEQMAIPGVVGKEILEEIPWGVEELLVHGGTMLLVLQIL
jgi:hypothetical protein